MGDLETPAGALTVSATSSNATVVPNANIVLGGAGANRTVSVTPVLNRFGMTQITLTVRDPAGAVASDSFGLDVLSVNDNPTVSPIGDQSTLENTPTLAIPFTIGDVETQPDNLRVTATSSTALVPIQNITIGGSGANRSVTVTPTTNQTGTAIITVVATDDQGGRGTSAFVENSNNGTTVGILLARDPGNDTLTYSITGHTSATAFAINSGSGAITVADSTQLDFETTPGFTLEVTVTDDDGATDVANVTINLLNQASISGTVFVDTDQDGQFDANEMGIDGVSVELLDANGAIVETAITIHGGFYLFVDFDPDIYRVHERQPTGVTDGAEQLGSLGGAIVANDTMELTLERVDALDYIFAELGQSVSSGDTATIGFWQNKQGRALIAQGGTSLADWLSSKFGNVFGNALLGANGEEVAEFYTNQLFKQTGKESAGPAKVDAQFMAVALATFFTSYNLAGNVAADLGFNVTDTGIGTQNVNVGSNGAPFNAPNDADLTIMQLLLATDSLTDQANAEIGFASIYDKNGDGVIDTEEAPFRSQANDIYTLINERGDI